MQDILANAGRLTDQMQEVIGFLEIGDPEKALKSAKLTVVTLHLISTALACQIAQADHAAAEVHRLTSELAFRNRPGPKSEKLT